MKKLSAAAQARARRFINEKGRPLERALATDAGAAPVEVVERWGLRSIWEAFRIDLRMRWRGLPARADGEGEA